LVAELAWWEVCTLVLLDLKTAKVSDMLAHPLMQARIRRSATKHMRSALWAHLQSHTKKECDDVAYSNRYEPLIFWKSKESVWSIDAPLAASEVPELPEALQRWKTYKPIADDIIRRYEFTTFHQSYSYEEFVEGIKPVLETEGTGDLRYEIKPGVLRQIATRAMRDPGHDYAIFIDEINRGNIASIFGELITLFEDDKRLGGKFEIKARLPYSRDEFGVPSNLYIIGTMNTADRSIEALDAALRRRFWFIPCPPKEALLHDVPGLDVNLRQMLTVINARLERLLDRDHCIGHSYFMGLAKAVEPLDALRRAFANKVLPLLEEYFYGDPGKIGLVLGSAFVRKRPIPAKFAHCGWEQDEDEDRESFERSDPMKLEVGAFQAIYA
jgi:5-methylcytosine-specific restriction endonuclease McrBC GTP-binding regulatory subunit McrB